MKVCVVQDLVRVCVVQDHVRVSVLRCLMGIVLYNVFVNICVLQDAIGLVLCVVLL